MECVVSAASSAWHMGHMCGTRGQVEVECLGLLYVYCLRGIECYAAIKGSLGPHVMSGSNVAGPEWVVDGGE